MVVDHHVSQDDLGATFLKDTSAEATGTLIVRAFHALGATITPEVATGLFTAIAMDTGWFRHPNTCPQTMRTAAELIEAGAEIDEIYRLLFEQNTVSRLKLMGETLSALQTDLDGRIAFTTVTREDLLRTGAHPPGYRGPRRLHREHRGRRGRLAVHRTGAGGIKLSVRSRTGLDCARLASGFGGGGHRAAAGATLPEPLSESVERVLAAVRQALAQNGLKTAPDTAVTLPSPA